ncbi:MAG: enoyl-CoA hydratase/isomerase family protein [Actinomycetota bacterium]|nr:enoyl-CoA hydratase/isomerase family protein [Actinomycetota bacterium]
MTYEVEADGAWALITIDRAERRNALNNEVVAQLLAGVTRARDDESVRAVILTGAGDRAFCAGADMDELRRRDHMSEVGPLSARRRELASLLERMPKPTIAAVNGHAMGGGLELALACTFRIASERAKLGLPEVTLGILPGNGGTQRLARLVGMGRALEMVLTGTPVEAFDALSMGLVHRVSPHGQVLDEARRLAAQLVALPPRALAAAKESVLASGDLALDAGISLENKWFAILCGSPEKSAALDARDAARSGVGDHKS